MEEEKTLDLTEVLESAFKKEINNALEQKSKDNEELASPNAMEEKKTPYTIEELKKLSEEKKEKAFEEIDETKIEKELLEKYKALQGMATKRQQYLAEKEKKIDQSLAEYEKIVNELNEFRDKLKNKIEELTDIDPDLENILKDLEKKDKELTKYNQEIANKNWIEAEARAKALFPDYGMYSQEQMTETLKKNPRLLELAMIDNGKFGDIVIIGAHLLTMLEENNFKNYIANELKNKPDKYADIIDEIIGKKIEEMEKKNEKKKNFTKLTEAQPQITIPPNQKNTGKVSYKDRFRDEFVKLLSNPSLLEEIKEKMQKGG